MGCDIHFFIEYKKDGKWHHAKRQHELPRDYSLFGLLAGVRDCTIATIGGHTKPLPNDLSENVAEYFKTHYTDELWLHSPNWLSLDEILKYKWTRKTKAWDGKDITYADMFSIFLDGAVAHMKKLKEEHEDVRCVFAFDN